MPSQVTKSELDDPKSNEIFYSFIEFFGPNQKSLSIKMAIINSMFCDIT